MYLSFSGKEAEAQLEQAVLTASRFSPTGGFAALGELSGENALCVLISFDASDDTVAQKGWEYAQHLYAYMQGNGVAPNVIGIGSAYRSPLKINESFAEACAAVQLVPHNKRLWRYNDVDPDNGALPEDSFHGLSPLSVSLLSEDRYAMNLLSSILGGGMSSRLFQSVREKNGLCYSVYTFTTPHMIPPSINTYRTAIPSFFLCM